MPRSLVSAWNELDVARYKAELYRMWNAGYHAGLPHPKVLAAAGSFRRSPTVERMRVELLRGVEQRNPLETTVRARPDLFIPFEASLIAPAKNRVVSRKSSSFWRVTLRPSIG